MTPNVWTIPPSRPFLETLIEGILEGRLVSGVSRSTDPLWLANVTLWLPTRRACRMAQDILLKQVGGHAALLPQMSPIGDVDPDALHFEEFRHGLSLAEQSMIPPSVSGIERQVLLARLIQGFARQMGGTALADISTSAALHLAQTLAHLMDLMATARASTEKLETLVPEEHDEWWDITRRFLLIARDHWPDILRERGRSDPAQRQDALLSRLSRQMQNHPPSGPVIIAGSTGSQPATADLIATISRLPLGCVVLPGLDMLLDEESWQQIRKKNITSHPQFGLSRLLEHLGLVRQQVRQLASPDQRGTEALLSHALRPASTTHLWKKRQTEMRLDHVTMIDAASVQEEAQAIALVLRESLEHPHATAAFITPDRSLARRVMAQLQRWHVAVDDSGGLPLLQAPQGIFARLVARVGCLGAQPVDLLGLLRHPLCRVETAGLDALELALLRGPRPRAGLKALCGAASELTIRYQAGKLRPSDPLMRAGLDTAPAAVMLNRIEDAFSPLLTLDPHSPQSLPALARATRQVVCAMAEEDRVTELLEALDEAGACEETSVSLSLSDWPETLTALLAGRMVRTAGAPDARIRILGPLEARLIPADVRVLGGLAEGIWPPQPQPDPFLNRAMKLALGLDLPERRIGLSAHDFTQSLGAARVVLTRAAKLQGVPTIPSRFLQRLEAVAPDQMASARQRGEHWLRLARALDMPPATLEPCPRPEPRPPATARPAALSVREIEDLLRDPYTIYARHILRLRPLAPVDAPVGQAERGTVIHETLAEYVQHLQQGRLRDPYGTLLEIGRRHFSAYELYPDVMGLWWPRFERVAQWFVLWQEQHGREVSVSHVEVPGKMPIYLPHGTFTLTARADRIDLLHDGTAMVLDYKSGAIPKEKQVRTGLAPQLALEAMMLRAGAFRDIPPVPVSQIAYVDIRGGDPAGELRPITFKDISVEDFVKLTLQRLKTLMARFADPRTPYRAMVSPMWAHRYGAYDHLARIREWSVTGGQEA